MNPFEKCFVCCKDSADGIVISGKFICSECEKKIVNLDINSDEYEYYKEKIRNNIVKVIDSL